MAENGRVPGTQGYAESAADLIPRYESVSLAQKFAAVLHLVPGAPSRVLDVGAGTGADASWFAALGHEVTAVEPTVELRRAGMRLHPSAHISWIDDALPGLDRLAGARERFDFILLSAVWMHLDPSERGMAMQSLSSLLSPKGRLVISLRHGPTPAGRRMFDVDAQETRSLAQASGLRMIADVSAASVLAANRDAGVTWTIVAFEHIDPNGGGVS